VRLTVAEGGSSVGVAASKPYINSTDIKIIIKENDAPIRFAQAEYRTEEGKFRNHLLLTVYRGLEQDGKTLIGPVARSASVSFYFVGGLATPGVDFEANNGTIHFSAGTMQSTISVAIRSDSLPEVDEDFQVVLSDPIGAVVLADPSVTVVILNANDDPFGVLRILAPTGDLKPIFNINEDTMSSFNGIRIHRSGGTHGTITINWRLTRSDGNPDPVEADISPASGQVRFFQGEPEKAVELKVTQDSMPEFSEIYTFELLPDTISGGARVEGAISATVIVEDSDDAHGLIQFASPSAQSLITVSRLYTLYV
jgi:hypothetical protein